MSSIVFYNPHPGCLVFFRVKIRRCRFGLIVIRFCRCWRRIHWPKSLSSSASAFSFIFQRLIAVLFCLLVRFRNFYGLSEQFSMHNLFVRSTVRKKTIQSRCLFLHFFPLVLLRVPFPDSFALFLPFKALHFSLRHSSPFHICSIRFNRTSVIMSHVACGGWQAQRKIYFVGDEVAALLRARSQNARFKVCVIWGRQGAYFNLVHFKVCATSWI